MHLLSLWDLDSATLSSMIEHATRLKETRDTEVNFVDGPLSKKTVVILLEKASTRTRLSFEIGIRELGGNAITLIAKDTQLGRGEPLSDTARMLSGYAHGVVYRTHEHERIEELAASSSIPVINGLSDRFHPCQVLADLQTIHQEFGEVLPRSVAWIGDGNNMANSWIVAAALLGFELRLACPKGYDPDERTITLATEKGAQISVVRSPLEAAHGADVVTTDVWASMGQEGEANDRQQVFASFGVTEEVMEAAKDTAIFLHCLPAHRGEEVAAEVIDGPQSRVWVEAENRLHAQKALLCHLFST